MDKDLYVLEWEGYNFHIETVDMMLRMNRHNFIEGRASRWIPLAFGTEREMEDLTVKYRHLMNKDCRNNAD